MIVVQFASFPFYNLGIHVILTTISDSFSF